MSGYVTDLLPENRNDEERECHTTQCSMRSICALNLFKSWVTFPVTAGASPRGLFFWSPQQGETPKCVE